MTNCSSRTTQSTSNSLAYNKRNMSSPTTNKLVARDEDSDSDGGVLLYDLKDHTPHPLSKTIAAFQFTFRIPIPCKMSLVEAILRCHKTSIRTPHHHGMSTTEDFAFDTLRRYVVPTKIDSESEPLQTHSSNSSFSDITELLDQATLSDSGPSQMTPRQIDRVLRRWTRNDRYFERECREREKRNPFPDVDMNIGWNRARYEIANHFKGIPGSLEERLKIQEGFAQFSFSRQLDAHVLTEDAWAAMFERIFVGAGRNKSAWSREPGSWWGARKRVFTAGRGDLVQTLKTTVKHIKQNVDLWWDDVVQMDSKVLSLKREHSIFADETTDDETHRETLTQGVKKPKMSGRKSEEVMSDTWRARRRLQEQKAGRWTDGTLRMDRLWDGFHWVLNVEDPKDMK